MRFEALTAILKDIPNAPQAQLQPSTQAPETAAQSEDWRSTECGASCASTETQLDRSNGEVSGECVAAKNEEAKAQTTYKPFYGTDTYIKYPELKRERPRHRMVCDMLAAGNTQQEICNELGYTPGSITRIKQQPWAQENILGMMSDTRTQVVEELKGAAVDAARKLAYIMRHGKREGDQAKAANSILDRLYPTGQVILHGKIDPDKLSDAELLELVNSST